MGSHPPGPGRPVGVRSLPGFFKKDTKLFKIQDDREHPGQLEVVLCNPAHSRVAWTEPDPRCWSRKTVWWKDPSGKPHQYDKSLTPAPRRNLHKHLRFASWQALSAGWMKKMIEENILRVGGGKDPYDIAKEDDLPTACLTIGNVTHLVTVSFCARIAGTTPERVQAVLDAIGCPTTTFKEGEPRFSLLVFELCYLMKALNVTAEEARKIHQSAETTFRRIADTGVTLRLRAFLLGRRPGLSKTSLQRKRR